MPQQVENLVMAACNRMDGLKEFFQRYEHCTKDKIPALYDDWSQTYNKDMDMLNYMVPKTVANLLHENISGDRGEVLVLDVACGTGKVAKLLFDLGFRRFVGVDGSKGMLEQAAKTGLYQDLSLALLGPEPLPVQTDTFDVVTIVSALDVCCIPVGVVRELCCATKPGGLVCMARGDHAATSETIRYKKDFQRECHLMEEEGLWKLLGIRHLDSYMTDLQLNPVTDIVEPRNIPGTVYLYQKATN